MNNASSVYNEEELELLEKSKSLRVVIVDNLMANSDPKDGRAYTSQMRLVNELLSSLDTSVHNSANTRIKHQDSSNKEAILDMVAETLKATAKKRNEIPQENLIREVPTEYLEIDVVPGETEIQPESLNPSDFLGGNDDNQ